MHPRIPTALAVLAIAAVNVVMAVPRTSASAEPLATASRFVAEAARAWVDSRALAWVVVLGGIGQIIGIGVYFWMMWTRIRPVGSALREAQGEKF